MPTTLSTTLMISGISAFYSFALFLDPESFLGHSEQMLLLLYFQEPKNGLLAAQSNIRRIDVYIHTVWPYLLSNWEDILGMPGGIDSHGQALASYHFPYQGHISTAS